MRETYRCHINLMCDSYVLARKTYSALKDWLNAEGWKSSIAIREGFIVHTLEPLSVRFPDVLRQILQNVIPEGVRIDIVIYDTYYSSMVDAKEDLLDFIKSLSAMDSIVSTLNPADRDNFERAKNLLSGVVDSMCSDILKEESLWFRGSED